MIRLSIKNDRVFFRDIYDHLVRLYDITESLRDLMGSVLDTYLSAINNRMNEIMKTLTIITTLFMPLSFLVGFFGMNFFIPDPPISRMGQRTCVLCGSVHHDFATDWHVRLDAPEKMDVKNR